MLRPQESAGSEGILDENLAEQLRILPENLANHLKITMVPLVVGLGISLPLAILVVRRRSLRYPVLTAVSIVQTVPSLALLALMVPLLVWVSSLTSGAFGFEISALGFWPTVIALTLYSMLPMVRNTVTGILGVDPRMVEAARGVGMTERQMLLRVQLPLAAPVIIAGIRTATVWVVGIATLATPVGQRCLGNYIFTGLQTRNWTAVVVGCAAAAVLAILLDLLIGGVERAVKERRRRLGAACAGALLFLVAGGLVAPAAVRMLFPGSAPAVGPDVIRIGAKTFTEQYILAELIQDRLEAAGLRARKIKSLGSMMVFNALVTGEIDAYVDYSGTIWANYMKQERTGSAEEVRRDVARWLKREHDVVSLGSLGFENAYGLAVTRRTAEDLGVETIGDLEAHAPDMVIGGDYEFFSRPEWRNIRDTYGLAFEEQKELDSTFMYAALVKGDVDVISAFTSDGRIEAYDLVVLGDPQQVIPPYDALLLLSPEASRRREVVAALEPLVGAVPVKTMRHANYMVDRQEDKRTEEEAAAWLERQIQEDR